MKKIIALALTLVMVFALFAVGGGTAFADDEGKVFNIYAWNEEFKGFFEKYYTVPEGVTVNWIITPSDNGAYQQKLDEALMNQDSAAADDKVDMFLAEADYILKYVDSDATQDVQALGVTDFSNTYAYTVQAASDADGVVKGVSFQCCPSALIYRRSIAKDVLGTDDPAEVQAALDSWDKFNAVAADAKAKGYYMTASFAETYRPFSNNCTSPWVDAEGNLQFDPQIEAWIAQTEDFVKNGYTLTAGVWDDEKNVQMFADGKTMCFFGPAWYFNFCMGNAMDPELADIMNTFINDEEVCTALVANEAQFSNNQAVNAKFAEDPDYGSEFLGGQNDVAVFAGMTDNIVWENHTIYDQLLNEGLQNNLREYFQGTVDKETALNNFYNYVEETYPAIVIP